MARKVIKDDVVSDNEGVSIGSVGSYVSAFKKDKEITKLTMQSSSKNTPTPSKVLKKPSDPNDLPEEYEPDTEKKIFVYYYCKFGNLDCDDFERVSGKVAAAINRLYGKALLPGDAFKKLDEHVTPADIDIEPYEESTIERGTVNNYEDTKYEKVEPQVKVDLLPGNYDFVKDQEPLDMKELDLVRFVEEGSLCFSSDGYKFYLAKHPAHKDCFDKLFDFTPKEEMVYMMFKDQLGDEHKAKKLVLMSRILNEPETSKVETTVKTTKKKAGRPRKNKTTNMFDNEQEKREKLRAHKSDQPKSTSGES